MKRYDICTGVSTGKCPTKGCGYHQVHRHPSSMAAGGFCQPRRATDEEVAAAILKGTIRRDL